MLKHSAGPLPRMRALRAFDAVARHESFVRAAEELGIHQPSVSRYVAELEREVGVRLFERNRRAVILTPAGEVLHRAVAVGLERIASGALSALNLWEDERIVIACGGATSELFLRPRLDALHRKLGETAVIRLLHCENSYLDRPNVMEIDRIDLLASYHGVEGVPGDEVAVFPEAIAPVCSPGFAEAHADVLSRPVAEWGALPFLDFARPSLGWATWDDWFETRRTSGPAAPLPQLRRLCLHDRRGNRGTGSHPGLVEFRRPLCHHRLAGRGAGRVRRVRTVPEAVRLTSYGRQRPIARRCLDAFASLANEAAHG